MDKPVQVGVIGLGRRWRRHYLPALRALRRHYRVRAVCDPVHCRAVRAAAELGCEAAAGPTALLEDDAIEALLLVDEPWYGLWPLELACRARRPVFCAWPLEADDAHADALRQQIRESGLPVLMALPLRLAEATVWLREVLKQQLGTPRLVVCDVLVPERRRRPAGALLGDVTTALLDWGVDVLDRPPQSVLAAGPAAVDFTRLAAETAAGDFTSVVLEFTGGRAVVVQTRRTRRLRRALRLCVEAHGGSAEVLLPSGSVGWTEGNRRCDVTLPGARRVARTLLEHFHATVRTGRAPDPSFEDAYQLLGWLRAAAVSRAEGRRVGLA
jgi:predicted dehydrogenase